MRYFYRCHINCKLSRRIAAEHAVAHLSLDILPHLEFRIPPVDEQRESHGSILSAYDDLIENNTRRIAILEEMARRIFEEWFVHFRAPGCEGLPMVDSADRADSAGVGGEAVWTRLCELRSERSRVKATGVASRLLCVQRQSA